MLRFPFSPVDLRAWSSCSLFWLVLVTAATVWTRFPTWTPPGVTGCWCMEPASCLCSGRKICTKNGPSARLQSTGTALRQCVLMDPEGLLPKKVSERRIFPVTVSQLWDTSMMMESWIFSFSIQQMASWRYVFRFNGGQILFVWNRLSQNSFLSLRRSSLMVRMVTSCGQQSLFVPVSFWTRLWSPPQRANQLSCSGPASQSQGREMLQWVCSD